MAEKSLNYTSIRRHRRLNSRYVNQITDVNCNRNVKHLPNFLTSRVTTKSFTPSHQPTSPATEISHKLPDHKMSFVTVTLLQYRNMDVMDDPDVTKLSG